MANGKMIALGSSIVFSAFLFGGLPTAAFGGFFVVLGMAWGSPDEYGSFPFSWWPVLIYIVIAIIVLIITYVPLGKLLS